MSIRRPEMIFKKKNKIIEYSKVTLALNEGCTNSSDCGGNLGTCTQNNSAAGCGCN